MESFRWEECFLTGIGEVDAQHRRLVDTTNRLGDLLAGTGTELVVGTESVMQELVDYTRTHFTDEERLMRAHGIAARHLEPHVAAHAQFVAELGPLRERATESPEAGEQTMKFLIHWLAYHILGTDRSMARQLAAIDGGERPEDAFLAEERERSSSTGPLLRALDGLFQQAYGRNRELSELNRTLEARVAERIEKLSEANARLEAMAMTDALTGLPNRRHAMSAFEREWDRADPEGVGVACAMIDADGFKPVNDAYGHEAGDIVLRELARALSHTVRTDDLVARLGGDEFLLICPRPDLEGARRIAEKVRETVASMRVAVGDGVWRGSVSVGVAARRDGMVRPEDLIKAADDAVYCAKKAGRNRVMTSDPTISAG